MIWEKFKALVAAVKAKAAAVEQKLDAKLAPLGPVGRFIAKGAAITYGVISLVVVSIVLVVGYLILSMTANSVPTSSLTSSQQSNLTNIINTTTSGYMLAVIVVLVLAAVLIIGVLLSGFGRGGR